jgi:hypothetical protein
MEEALGFISPEDVHVFHSCDGKREGLAIEASHDRCPAWQFLLVEHDLESDLFLALWRVVLGDPMLS